MFWRSSTIKTFSWEQWRYLGLTSLEAIWLLIKPAVPILARHQGFDMLVESKWKDQYSKHQTEYILTPNRMHPSVSIDIGLRMNHSIRYKQATADVTVRGRIFVKNLAEMPRAPNTGNAKALNNSTFFPSLFLIVSQHFPKVPVYTQITY